MKYAVPVHNGRLSPHFGKSTEFALIETDASRITNKEIITVQVNGCCGVPRLLAGRGVNIVLAGGMGLPPLMFFDQHGVDVVSGIVETDAEQAVMAHLNHTLVSGRDVCGERKWPAAKPQHH